MKHTEKSTQTLEVLVEEHAFGSVRSVEAVADAPVSALVPALVEALRLPQTDLFGKNLTYILRRAEDGCVVPEYSTLRTSGILPGERLTLDSFAPEEVNWNALYSNQSFTGSNADLSLHSSNTLTDLNLTPAGRTSTNLLPLKKERKWTRRAFMGLGSVAIGVVSTGIGYAAYRNYLSRIGLHQDTVQSPLAHTTAVAQPTSAVAKPASSSRQAMTPSLLKRQTTFTHHQQVVRTVAWSPDGMMLASGADDSQVFLWRTNGAVQTTLAHPTSVAALAWSPDGKRLVTGSGTQLAFFDAQTGKCLARSTGAHTRMITSVAWAARGLTQVVSAGEDEHAIVWNTTTYQPQTVYRQHTAVIEQVAWAANGQTVATSSQGGYIRVWTASDGRDVHSHYQDTTVPLRALAFAPIGLQLATGGDDGMVRLWHNGLTCQKQQEQGIDSICRDTPQRLHASPSALLTVAWSPDGHFLAVGTTDGVLSLWDPQSPQQPLLKVQLKAPVQSVAWSPDTMYLASASGKTISIWAVM